VVGKAKNGGGKDFHSTKSRRRGIRGDGGCNYISIHFYFCLGTKKLTQGCNYITQSYFTLLHSYPVHVPQAITKTKYIQRLLKKGQVVTLFI
jgi:hypothetical protein